MATTGWLGEQTVHQWGGWGTRFTTNVYISGIRRYSDHVDVSGTIYLYCKSNGAYSVWYDWNITSWSMGNNLGQIKERTYTNNILNRSWGKNFTVRINCSNSATSATFNAGFSDSNMGGRDKYWTIYFDRYATAPSGIKSTSSYTEYSTITTSCSGINWGQGYSNRTLTCTASYTFNGKTENFTLGTWNDGATSKTVTKNDFNFPADLNVSIKWVASTNVGSTTSSSQVRVGQTYPAPNLSEVNFEGSSPSTYKLNATVTGINYGENYSKREANLYFDYTLDGISYSTLLSSISDGSTSMTVEYDATTESEPWKFIPDDEKGVLRLVVDNGHRTSTKSSAQIYCQPQYEAYIVESIPDSEKEKSEIYTGKNIQIQNAPKDAPLADFKLYGDTFQQIYTGKNLANTFDMTEETNSGLTVTKGSDGAIILNGTQTAVCNIRIDETALFAGLVGEELTISVSTSGTGMWSNFGLKTPGASIIAPANPTNPTITRTLTSSSTGKYYLDLYIKNNGTTFTDFKIYLQVEKSSTATPYEPFVGGQPSPNPDYPQPIQVVTGLQTVEIQGKNLFNNEPKTNSKFNITTNSQVTRVVRDITSWWNLEWSGDKLNLVPGETYTARLFILDNPKNYAKKINLLFDIQGKLAAQSVLLTAASGYQKTFTYELTRPLCYLRVAFEGNNAGVDITFCIQIEKGSTATAFVPYSKQTYEINLGKNLFNRNDVVNGVPSASDGSITSTSSVSRTSDYIQVTPNTDYSHTGHPLGWSTVAWYRADKSFIKRVDNVTATTSPNEAAYARVSCAQDNLDTCQFEAGKPTSYAPYFEPIELCKLGDYQDYIWKDGEDWKVRKAIKKSVFDQNSGWAKNLYGTNAYNAKAADIFTAVAEIGVISTQFIAKSYNDRAVATNNIIYADSNNGMSAKDRGITIRNTAWSDLTSFITWVTSNPVIAYYVLATPTDTIITEQTLIEQLEAIRKASLQNGINNINNIAIAPNLAGDMDIRYYTKWQDTFPATLYSNGKNGTGQFKQIRRIGTK